MSTKLNYEELIITPEMAKEFLSKCGNPNNRSINRAKVLMYAREMKEGKWTLDGEPISFDWFGRLHNGHHRCEAVVEAGVPVEFSVIRNVNPETFVFVDTARSRTASDVFKMKCIENYTNVSSIVRRFDALNKNITIVQSGNSSASIGDNKSGSKLTSEEALALYEQNPEEFQEFCNYAQCLRNHRRYYNISELGAIMAYLHLTLGYGKEMIYNFFNMIHEYKTTEDYALCKEVRETLDNAARAYVRLSGIYKQAILATAWNLYRKGDKKRKRLNVPRNTKLIPFE